MSRPATPIGIAVVEHDGCYLVGVRSEDTELAGCDEFPGGKCRRGEPPQACAVRECLEETGLDVLPVRLLLNRKFDYPHGAVDLHFWLCRPARPNALDDLPAGGHGTSGGYRWVASAELAALKFPEANRPVIDILTQRAER